MNNIQAYIFSAIFMAGMLIVLAVQGADVPRPEHPRPDFHRGDSSWQNLNGEWDFAFDPKDKGLGLRVTSPAIQRDSLPDKIIVPYHVESELSGVHNTRPPEVCWYLRHFDLDIDSSERVLLHFGAVDYQATVWLNGVKLGEHIGGYTPFTFEITGKVKEKDNVLVLRVKDSLNRMQVRGKQSPSGEPHGIMYTTVTGIWQTVWLEAVPHTYLKSFKFVPADDLKGGRFIVDIQGDKKDISTRVMLIHPGKRLEVTKVGLKNGSGEWRCTAGDVTLSTPAVAWSPDNPILYSIDIILENQRGDVVDLVHSYVGLRTVEVKGNRVFLNGEPFYQKLLLDQGYFPGGHYTPATDAIMRQDVETYKAMGFNGLRKHQKVEDPRFLYWCDVLGLVVWEEMPSLGFGFPRRVPDWAMQRFQDEWLEVIERDYNHPSIITWAPYNENWGIGEALWRKASRKWAYKTVKLTREADPTRLVTDNSGGFHFDTDVFDFHQYLPTVEATRDLYDEYNFQPGDYHGIAWWVGRLLRGKALFDPFLPKVPYKGQPMIVSEYGGFGFYPTEGNKGLLEMYRDYTLAIGDFDYIQGYCYTQPYDVEQEQNGLMTFQREPKVPVEEIKKINDQMYKD